MDKKRIVTGDRPTGRLHIGHYFGSLKNRVKLQESGEYDQYILIADVQALTDNFNNPEKVRKNVREVLMDYLSVGIDPEKTTIYIQSMIPETAELTVFYSNLVTIARLERNPTVKTEIAQKRDLFGESVTYGFLGYPVSQAADITVMDGTIIPVGEDQLPLIEQCREIVRKFNSIYGDTLVEPKILLPENKNCLRLPGTDGKAKMSKSLNNCIYLSDTAEEVSKKVMSMFTDPNHLKVSDPGETEGNPVFIYLEAFANDEHFKKFWPEYENLEALESHYRRGGLGDVKVKRFLVNVLNDTLEPIRERRKELEKDIPAIYDILKEGSIYAQKIAARTLSEVKKAMRINYFDDDSLIRNHQEKFGK